MALLHKKIIAELGVTADGIFLAPFRSQIFLAVLEAPVNPDRRIDSSLSNAAIAPL